MVSEVLQLRFSCYDNLSDPMELYGNILQELGVCGFLELLPRNLSGYDTTLAEEFKGTEKELKAYFRRICQATNYSVNTTVAAYPKILEPGNCLIAFSEFKENQATIYFCLEENCGVVVKLIILETSPLFMPQNKKKLNELRNLFDTE